jgi:hypothetical protein
MIKRRKRITIEIYNSILRYAHYCNSTIHGFIESAICIGWFYTEE